MSYLVLARKYRPQTFSDVVQQEHVTKTLANAIKTGRLAHAILFAGPRGTGKTTIARILAKAMNCEKGPAETPCNACRSCLDITSGHAADVFEIDGASNNSVDQVRELRENLKYMPVHSRYKIYIIDEVHMLSLAAFNALLKTLEEPPEHILFFFATTEVHKIPVTILSRCQRHDLRRIDATEIADHLEKLCRGEAFEIDQQSLMLISQEAGGSMRDALSLLDHILACVQGSADVRSICDLLGIADRRQLFQLTEAVLEKNIAAVLEQIDAVWRQGYEMKRYYSDLVSFFHNLVLVGLGQQAANLVDLPEYEIDQIRKITKGIAQSHLVHLFDFLFQAEPTVKLSNHPKYAIEIIFLKLFQQTPPLPIDSLIESLDKLRKELLSTAPSAPSPEKMENDCASNRPAVSHLPKSVPEVVAAAGQSSHPAGVTDTAKDLNPFLENGVLWRKMLDFIQEQKPSLTAILKKCNFKAISGRHLEVEVGGNEFTLNSVKKHSAYLESVGGQLAGRPVTIAIVANLEDADLKQQEKHKTEQLKKKALSHPMVMEAIELFNGKVVDVKIE